MNKHEDLDGLVKKGKYSFQNKSYVESAKYFQEAARRYAELGDTLMAAEQANNWSVAALQAGDYDTAYSAVEGTPEIFAAENDLFREGMAYGNLAAACEALDRLEDAYTYYEKSAEILKEAGDNETRMHVMQALSSLQLRTGRQLQALATMQAGIENISQPSMKQRFLKKLLNIPTKYISGE